MAREIMSEYRVTAIDGSEVIAVRNNIVGVAKDFENADIPIVQIQRTRTNLDVHIPEERKQVFFKTFVTPQAAVDASCIATPFQFTVYEHTNVVLQAVPTAGFAFDGWYLSAPINAEEADTFDAGVPVSTDAVFSLRITAPGPGQERVIEARFTPSP